MVFSSLDTCLETAALHNSTPEIHTTRTLSASFLAEQNNQVEENVPKELIEGGKAEPKRHQGLEQTAQ